MTNRKWAGRLFLLPGVVWILAFTLFPLVYSLYISLTDWRLGRGQNFIGLENFADIFRDVRVSETVTTSIMLSVGGTLLTLLFGTLVAWLFNRELPGLRKFRSVMVMPLFAAPIAVGFLAQVIFNETNGPINTIIASMGGPHIKWVIDPFWARMTVMLTDTWQWTPFVFIVVLAAMQSISDEYYEAARIDTASEWQLFRHITFPLITPALGTVALLRLVETFKIYDIPRSLTGGGPGTATQTYTYYITVQFTKNYDFGYTAALAWLLVLLSVVIATAYFLRVRERFEIDV